MPDDPAAPLVPAYRTINCVLDCSPPRHAGACPWAAPLVPPPHLVALVEQWREDHGPDDHSLVYATRQECADQLEAALRVGAPTVQAVEKADE